jgi:hypothetical protein
VLAFRKVSTVMDQIIFRPLEDLNFQVFMKVHLVKTTLIFEFQSLHQESKNTKNTSLLNGMKTLDV